METKVFAKSPSILKNLKCAALVDGIVKVVAFFVELIDEIPCVIVLVDPDVLTSQISTTLPATKLVCEIVKSDVKFALIIESVA